VNSVYVVYLWGLMGAGKSHSGRVLAKHFGVNFIDLDIQIEQKTGRSISKIFDEFGESEFRRIELETLRALHLIEHTIVAVGGGTPCFNDNDQFMLDNGICIWLNPEIDIVLNRLENKAGVRPLLGGDEEKMRDTMFRLMEDRIHCYSKANYAVTSHAELLALITDQQIFIPNK
jgi:shikimate kinase